MSMTLRVTNRPPMLGGSQLEPVDDLWVNIPDDELCHAMLLLPGRSFTVDINDITVRYPALGERVGGRYSQLIEADTVIRQTGTPPWSPLPLKQPAPCP
jgi:hypothetical protein